LISLLDSFGQIGPTRRRVRFSPRMNNEFIRPAFLLESSAWLPSI